MGTAELTMHMRVAVVMFIAGLAVTSGSPPTDIECTTTAGSFTIRLFPEQSPLGVARFIELVEDGFFTDQLFYRVIPGFLMQFGVAAEPKMMAEWDSQTFADEPKKAPFEHGTVSFAGNGIDSRSCHLFIALQPNGLGLGNAPHETPLGKIVHGIETLQALTSNYERSQYGDLTHLQGEIASRGNAAAEQFPQLDKIQKCRIVAENPKEL